MTDRPPEHMHVVSHIKNLTNLLGGTGAIIFGTTAGTVCQGNDSRLSDTRTPSSHGNEKHSATYITAADAVVPNAPITGATKTKLTYDAKGLVTSGTDATTADIADSTNKRYCTDAEKVVIGNTSNTNTGDKTLADLGGIAHSLATALSDFLVASEAGVFVKKTLAEVKTILGLGSAAYTASTDYATSAKGVTNGDSHDHNGGDGAQIAYSTLGSIPSTFAPASHDNTAHSSAYALASDLSTHTGYTITAHGGLLASTAFSGFAKITVAASAPGSPSTNDLWIDIS